MSEFAVSLSADERFLEVAFADVHRTLSWAIHGGGFGLHRRVVWHFVRRDELTYDVDPAFLLAERLRGQGYTEAVGLLTARQLPPFGFARSEHAGVVAQALVTVGLGNALRAGDPPAAHPPAGTINVLVRASLALSDAGLLEALSLATEARTLAVVECNYPSVVSGAPASGTGTDCIVVATPARVERAPYAGKHTAVGAAIGESVLLATRRATELWLAERR